jgi:hypothetical protein
MEYFVTIEDALGKIEHLHSLTESKSKNGECKRFIALNELVRKIRISLNALHYIPYEKYEVLCAPANLLYRSMITDLMTSLLISQVDDKQLEDIIYIFDRDFTNSLKSALKANIEIRKETYPEDVDAFDEQATEYQEKLYDELKDYLSSAKGEDWKLKKKTPIYINGERFDGQISQIYKILRTFEEVSGYAYAYQYYRLFSQSEHFSIKGRIINHKQTFHEEYYNKVRALVYLGAELLYNKYSGTNI